MKQATVYRNNVPAGVLTEDDMGYEFRYDSDYLKTESERNARPVISTHECNYGLWRKTKMVPRS